MHPMPMNWMVLPTLVATFIFYVAGVRAWRWSAESISRRAWVLVGAAFLATVGLLVPAYYLHGFDRWAWYFEFRARPGTEITAAGIGMAVGIVGALLERYRIKAITRPFLLALLAFGIAAPHLKPVFFPLSMEDAMEDRWRGEVCLQSTGSTCGPASAATLLRAEGVRVTEAEIAGQCFTYLGGTENWYLARFFHRIGFNVGYVIRDGNDTARLPVPSIAGVGTGGAGHFIPILAATENGYITGDPLAGRQEYTKAEIGKRFRFTGFFMQIGPAKAARPSTE